MNDTIEYYIKNKKNEKAEFVIPSIIEEIITDRKLDISEIKKLSVSLSINDKQFLPFHYNEEINLVKVITYIQGQLEYVNDSFQTNLYNFILPKTILLELRTTHLNPILSCEVYTYEAICRKESINSFYISLFTDFNLNIL